jgi:hypothetical protein
MIHLLVLAFVGAMILVQTAEPPSAQGPQAQVTQQPSIEVPQAQVTPPPARQEPLAQVTRRSAAQPPQIQMTTPPIDVQVVQQPQSQATPPQAVQTPQAQVTPPPVPQAQVTPPPAPPVPQAQVTPPPAGAQAPQVQMTTPQIDVVKELQVPLAPPSAAQAPQTANPAPIATPPDMAPNEVPAANQSLLPDAAATPYQAPSLAEGRISEAQIQANLEAQGYTDITPTDVKSTDYQVMAKKNGQMFLLVLDPTTGQITSSNPN